MILQCYLHTFFLYFELFLGYDNDILEVICNFFHVGDMFDEIIGLEFQQKHYSPARLSKPITQF